MTLWTAACFIGLSAAVILLARNVHRLNRFAVKQANVTIDIGRLLNLITNNAMAASLRKPLVYCPRHGGQEQMDGVCVQCRAES